MNEGLLPHAKTQRRKDAKTPRAFYGLVVILCGLAALREQYNKKGRIP